MVMALAISTAGTLAGVMVEVDTKELGMPKETVMVTALSSINLTNSLYGDKRETDRPD